MITFKRVIDKKVIDKKGIEKKEKIYTGAITGLGFDSNIKKPVYAEYDIETQFDCEYDDNDFSLVCLFSIFYFFCLLNLKI